MEVSSIAPVWERAAIVQFLSLLQAATPTFPTINCHFFTAGPTAITPSFAISDFTELVLTGYSPSSIDPSFIVNLPNGLGVGATDFVSLVVTTAPTPPGINVLGYWMDYGTGPVKPLIAEIFPTPVPLVKTGDYLFLNFYLPLLFQNSVV